MVQSIDDARRQQRRAGAGRVPPHNLEAEESLLGAMLLSRDAIVAAVEAQLSGTDFYKPAHGHIYEAITSLYGQGEPPDPVTVAEELRRAGLLEAVGGGAVLISLQSGTPATSNAARYANIVEEYSLLRRLITVAGEIAEIGYGLPDDVTAAVDEAEALVFDVAQRRVTDSMAPIRDLLERHLDHIEALYERGEDIIGVPTGFIDLDHQLAGLQPSNLVIIGGRPGMGKALALDTPIPTPTGWTTMAELGAGDEVLDGKGRPCRVTYATPVMHDRVCYEVSFDDGSTIVADADHQWFAYDLPAWKSLRSKHYREMAPPRNAALARDQSWKRRLPRVVTTQQMRDEGILTADDGRLNWYVPLSKPLDLSEASLPVDPYVLGCWLGDGKSSGSEMTIGEADHDHFHAEFSAAGYAFERRVGLQWATVPVSGRGAWQGYDGNRRTLTRELQAVGLLGGAVKHIPAAYLRASFAQRLALLQGILDTDGHIQPSGSVDLCLSNRRLVDQARELVCSLGHKPGPVRERTLRLPDGRLTKAWRFRWTPLDPVFRLKRKAARYEAAHSRRVSGRITRRAITGIRAVQSVPVRCISVDSPGRLYLAGESMIPTHNTSFGLGIAAHAAIDGRAPVLVFSLEMSHLELTQRLLCSEARVDATRMRNGRLLESDWPKISHAVGRLAEAPIHIDDNPHLTVMEIRAKARRLKSRQGLGLIIIDYLQLMTGRHSAENRQVEVSEISRGLKILARELEVPVIALSQLSRNLETRSDKRPVLADLRESGCLPASTRVMRADNGEEITLGELVLSQAQPMVWSVDDHQKLVPARVLKAFPSGIKPVFKLHLASGRSVTASANHPFLTIDGWTRLDALEAGSFIAVPRRLPAPLQTGTSWSDDELALLAHMIGDGSMGPSFKYATADPANKQVVQELALRLFGIKAESKKLGNTWQMWLPSPYKMTHGVHHPMRNWLEPHGLWTSRSSTKFIPQSIFGLGDDQVALFLRHLWASGPVVRTYYPTPSHGLALDVQRLLLRLGVRSSIGRAKKQQVGPAADGVQPYHESYIIRIAGAASRARFLSVIRGDGQSAPETSDLFWDRVVEVASLGDEPTFDVTIEETHNFIADGIVSHNSLEQDSDVVIFLYRDELYNRDSADRGTAEVIVAKHRNGPTGSTQLAFLEQYTRFANMARGV